jgi:hypothetical protein
MEGLRLRSLWLSATQDYLNAIEKILWNDRLVQSFDRLEFRAAGQRDPSWIERVDQNMVECLRAQLCPTDGSEPFIGDDLQRSCLDLARVDQLEPFEDERGADRIRLYVGSGLTVNVEVSERSPPGDAARQDRIPYSHTLLLRMGIGKILVKCSEDVCRQLSHD